MAKQNNTDTKPSAVKGNELVANCDHTLSIKQVEGMIFTIRGVQVMRDSDLAMLYGVETKRLNEQVKRNIERFPDDFMFQLTMDEAKIARSHFATLKSQNVIMESLAIPPRSQNATLDTAKGTEHQISPIRFHRNRYCNAQQRVAFTDGCRCEYPDYAGIHSHASFSCLQCTGIPTT